MKKIFPILLAFAMLLNLCSAALADETGDVLVFENGMAQPILKYTNLGETNIKAFLTKERLNHLVPKHTLGVMETGGGLKRTKVVDFVKCNTTAKLITFGHGDLGNYGGGYDGRDYTKPEEPMKAGEYYDWTDVFYPKEEVSNFDEVFGKNTGYVIDPEECMADNFKFAVFYGMDGPTGEGYPNPEIIEGVIEILSK